MTTYDLSASGVVPGTTTFDPTASRWYVIE